MILIAEIKPFTSKQILVMQLINEGFALLTIYTLFCFTDFVPDDFGKNVIDFVLVGITCINIAVNVGKMIVEKVTQVMSYSKGRYMIYLQ